MAIVGIFGSSSVEPAPIIELAQELGRALAARGCTVVTGACSGLPYAAALAASRRGAGIWGFSPVNNMEEQREFAPEDDPAIYTHLHFVPPSFPFNADLLVAKKYRNVISTAHCDAGIIIGGKWGTLNELTNLLDYGKVAGVLEGSGGITDQIRGLASSIGTGEGRLVFGRSPEELVGAILAELESRAEMEDGGLPTT